MDRGTLHAIFVAQRPRAPMRAVPAARAVPGRGLEGDRYFDGTGTFSAPRPDHEVTLVELEAVEAVGRESGTPLGPEETRRNLVTRGVSLDGLMGRKFRVGGVRLLGIRSCDPCAHLERLTRPGVQRALQHRGGLRAAVLSEGWVRVGDPVRLDEPPSEHARSEDAPPAEQTRFHGGGGGRVPG